MQDPSGCGVSVGAGRVQGGGEGESFHQVPMATGPLGSLLLFGGFTICLNGFRMGYDLSHSHCKSQLELIFPVVEIIFVSIQVTGLSLRQATRTHAPACAREQPPRQMPTWLSLYARHGPQQMPVSVSPHPHSAYTCTGTHHVTELQTLVNPSACACSRVSKPTPVGVQSCSQPRMSGSLLTACSAPGMVLHLHHLFYFHDKWAFPERLAFQSHFRAEETEAQRYRTTGPKAHSKGTVEPGP